MNSSASMGPPYDASFLEARESAPIRNFHLVEPWLYRGGQPGEDGIQWLGQIGVKTVICLRWGKRTIAAEEASVKANGMNFVSIRLSYWVMPSKEKIEQFLSLIDNADNHPVFVHCLHGADRTGLLIAIFRITRRGWTVQDAYKEMKRYGFHRFRVRNFKWWLWKFANMHFD